MTTNTAQVPVRLYVELDGEVAQALDRARKDKRLSRPQFIRSTLAAALLEIGALASAVREPAR
ncbi:hypothetical protein FV242_08305 [Methylobacterium sp. WL64]|uniref:hypothetical protein n=1 Tax=Methylobacterium sp. WL64 TaxID=2603894 RepID=UPI0011CA5A38|nr:hypothetical protein [Methylobacterium sp. WL64]TXN04207.1 hypothetical protein FV242_08305 [Methylobacterium sp. WL64]